MRRLARRFAMVTLCALVGLSGAAGILAAEPRSSESDLELQLKAAFILNFARFVEWPTNAFASPTNAVVIGVLGDTPVARYIRVAVGRTTIENRPVVVQQFNDADKIGTCHALFIGASKRERLPSIMGKLEGRPVLTVGDVDGFIDEGGIINLKKNRQDMLRFYINRPAAERAGLKISSKLLKLSENFGR